MFFSSSQILYKGKDFSFLFNWTQKVLHWEGQRIIVIKFLVLISLLFILKETLSVFRGRREGSGRTNDVSEKKVF